jgi:hypothetical protein
VIPTVRITRYATPLREGGSLPGLIEADDLGMYVCKFRGAGQGPRVLAAEVIVSELARQFGLHTPRLVALDLGSDIARYEADEEVQDLLRASVGLNLGVDFLPGSFGHETLHVADEEAAKVFWLDAFTANVDRTWRNPNLLQWHGDLWLIDHGAALYFHHGWRHHLTDPQRFAEQRWDASGHVFEQVVVKSSVLLGQTMAWARDVLTQDVLVGAVAQIPEDWLVPVPGVRAPDELRTAYVNALSERLHTDVWLPGSGGVCDG